MSNYLPDNIKEGDTIELMPPYGKFTVVPDANRSTTYVLIAGGSGITPMMGIAKAVLNDEPKSHLILLYANRNPESVIFKDTLAEMEKSSNGRLKIIHNYDSAPLTWFGLKGFLTEDKIHNILHSKIGGPFLWSKSDDGCGEKGTYQGRDSI
jgi:ring-1,2-phenylacetyl-CoA epoxidase subunit PaaE